MTYEELTDDTLVLDKTRNSYGIGRVESTRDGIVYVWFDEVETTIHYKETDLENLEPLDV